MYISLQSPDLIFDQLNALSTDLALYDDITVTIVIGDSDELVYLKHLSDLTQYGSGYHLDVVGCTMRTLDLKIVKDTNRKPNYNETFSSLLLKSNRMKHLDRSDSTNKSEVDEFKHAEDMGAVHGVYPYVNYPANGGVNNKLTDNCDELLEVEHPDSSVEMGVYFEDHDEPDECSEEFEDKYVPQQHPVSPLMEAVLNRFKK